MTAAIIIFAVVYAFIAIGRPPHSIVAILGAMLVIFLGVVPEETALMHIDLEVVLLLAGMMVIANVIGRTGVFDWAALKSVQIVRGDGFWLLCLTALLVAVASALLDNVTVVVLAVPVTLSLCRNLDLDPFPFLITQVFASNIGGTATIVGDPPNIIVASAAHIGFATFIGHAAPVTLMSLAALFGLSYLWFRDRVTNSPAARDAIMVRDPSESIRDRGLLLKSALVLLGVIAVFLIHEQLHVSPAIAALSGAAVLLLITKSDPVDALKHVEWPTLAFFAGLFILVGALVETGVTTEIQKWMQDVTGSNENLLGLMILGVSALASAMVDNIPFTATMAPIITEISGGEGSHFFWWALVFGADLGGNATIVGASANVTVLGLARASGYNTSFMQFLKYGWLIATATILISMGYLWLRYYA